MTKGKTDNVVKLFDRFKIVSENLNQYRFNHTNGLNSSKLHNKKQGEMLNVLASVLVSVLASVLAQSFLMGS